MIIFIKIKPTISSSKYIAMEVALSQKNEKWWNKVNAGEH